MKNFIIMILLLFFISPSIYADYVNLDSSEVILLAKKKSKKYYRARKKAKAKKAKLQAEKKAKLEAEQKAKDEAQKAAKLKAEEDTRLKLEEEAKLKLEKDLELQAKKDAEEKAKLEAENKAKIATKLEAKRKAKRKAAKANSNLFSLAFKINLTVPTSQINTTYALHLEMRYHIIKDLSIGLDLGYYPMAGEGENLDSQIGLYDYKWSINSIPIYLGVNYSLSIIKNFLIEAQLGFASVFAFSEGETFNGTNEASDVAYGYYIGIGAILRLGKMGDIIGELKYTGMYLDFDYPDFNEKLGDMGGKSIIVGYRYIF